jgi:hypothetical protein
MLKLVEKLGLEETREVPDPFGLGVVYSIRHIQHPLYVEHVKAKGEAPILTLLKAKATKAMYIAQAQSRGDNEKADEQYGKLIKEYLEDIPEERLVFSETDIDGVAKLIAGWEGDDEPYSHAAAVELLSSENAIPVPLREGEDLLIPAGSALGAALCTWVLYQARQIEQYNAQAMEAVEGN